MVNRARGLIMEVVIGLILLLFLTFGTGYYFRRNIYREVDRLERWKIDIMNKSIMDEFSKVKELKMTGQTEEFFEKWRKEWDDIITSQLPEVEELLFDAEEFADKYRFKKSKNTLLHIESILKETESQIDRIIKEINDLVTSEEKNSEESEEVKKLFKSLKKVLITQSHTFGAAQQKLESILYECSEGLKRFELETEAGNHLLARDIIIEQKEALAELKEKMEFIPKYLTDCQSILPQQIQELRNGYEEMLEQGYVLSHIDMEKEISSMNQSLDNLKSQLIDGELDGVHQGLEEINEMVEALYDLLEKEVYASHFVKSEIGSYGEKLNQLMDEKNETHEETAVVKQSYTLSDAEIENMRKIEKKIQQLQKQYDQMCIQLEESHVAHSVIKDELEEFNRQLEETRKQHEEFRQMLYTLRKDELEARDKIVELKRAMMDIRRSIQKSNVPGLPIRILDKMEVAQQSLVNVNHKISDVPLNMSAVHEQLNDAVSVIESLKSETEEMIEQVYLVEKVIQYGNRYRRQYQTLAQQLQEAEELFRNYEYGRSLEQAASAIEKVEPGAIERIQAIIEEEMKLKS